jgi:hypothetical protein
MTITIFHNFQTKNGCCLIMQVCICNLNCLTMTIRSSPLQYSTHPFNGNLVGARDESARGPLRHLSHKKTKPVPLVGVFRSRKGATRCKIVWSPKGPASCMREICLFVCCLACFYLLVGCVCFKSKSRTCSLCVRWSDLM